VSHKNQWGQEIDVGDVVGYVTKSGSNFTRKIGRVIKFGTRHVWPQDDEVTVWVHWQWIGGDHDGKARAIDDTGSGVSINRVFVLDPDSLGLEIL
jgi:hypothetical protein